MGGDVFLPDPDDVRTGNEGLNGCGNQRPDNQILTHIEKFSAGMFEHLHELAAMMNVPMYVLMSAVRIHDGGSSLPHGIAFHEEVYDKADCETDGDGQSHSRIDHFGSRPESGECRGEYDRVDDWSDQYKYDACIQRHPFGDKPANDRNHPAFAKREYDSEQTCD